MKLSKDPVRRALQMTQISLRVAATRKLSGRALARYLENDIQRIQSVLDANPERASSGGEQTKGEGEPV